MQDEQEDLLTDDYLDQTKSRKELLPWWIKVFMWIFLVLGVFVVGIAFASIFEFSTVLSLYGFSTTEIWSPVGILLLFVFILKAVTSYGLIAKKSWAIKLGITDAGLGIFLCLFVIVYTIATKGFNFSMRLELLFLVPYLLRLLRIRVEWESAVS